MIIIDLFVFYRNECVLSSFLLLFIHERIWIFRNLSELRRKYVLIANNTRAIRLYDLLLFEGTIKNNLFVFVFNDYFHGSFRYELFGILCVAKGLLVADLLATTSILVEITARDSILPHAHTHVSLVFTNWFTHRVIHFYFTDVFPIIAVLLFARVDVLTVFQKSLSARAVACAVELAVVHLSAFIVAHVGQGNGLMTSINAVDVPLALPLAGVARVSHLVSHIELALNFGVAWRNFRILL